MTVWSFAINLRQNIALFDLLSFAKSDIDQFTVDADVHGDGVVGLYGSDPGEEQGNIVSADGHHGHRNGSRLADDHLLTSDSGNTPNKNGDDDEAGDARQKPEIYAIEFHELSPDRTLRCDMD